MKTGKIRGAAENLFPGYFALVMATGIISIAAFQLSLKPVARVLLVINVIAYTILFSLGVRQCMNHPPTVVGGIFAFCAKPR